ncbi:hypothetical protein C0995_007099 [Termitomyces sp. Mi166|nr:hypothetical protein C0995_007099 [Termitomyces sp. Mi166\
MTRSHHPLDDSDWDENTSDVDEESVASLPPFSFPPSVSASSSISHDASMHSASPVPSVFSISSSMRAQVVRQEFGRAINNYSGVYKLPADDEELDRLGSVLIT